jgi:CDP-archaeol synthase
MQTALILKLLLLLIIANGVPVVAKCLLGERLSFPLDGHARFFDGRPLFGASKTIRGLVLSIATTSGVAPLLALSLSTGFLVGSGAMVGDIMSSFMKRRLRLKASSRATGLDQIPESLLPSLLCSLQLSLNAADVVAIVSAFFVGEIVLSRWLFRMHIRDRPY